MLRKVFYYNLEAGGEIMKSRNVWSNDGIEIYDNEVWFVPFETNVLCSYSLSERKVNRIFTLNEWEVSSGISYNTIEFEENIISIPGRGEGIYFVDKDKKINIYDKIGDGIEEKYDCAVKFNSSVYIFPLGEQEILKVSMDKMEKIEWNGGGVSSAVVYNDNIYFTNVTNSVFKIDKDDKIKRCIISGIDEVNNICFWKNSAIVLSKDGQVSLVDLEENKVIKQPLSIGEGDFFSSSVVLNDRLYLFPYKDSTTIWIYDLENQKIHHIKIEKGDKYNEEWEYNAFGHSTVYENKIYVMSPSNNALIVINQDEIETIYIDLKPNEEEQFEYMRKAFEHGILVEENDFSSLKTMIKYMEK